MEAIAIAVEGFALAEWLRFSRWGYATVNAAHILGLALLVGATAALDLRLVGFWKTVSLEDLYRVLSPTATTGLSISVITGIALFSVRATEYVQLTLFFAKIGFIVSATVLAAFIHFRYEVENFSKNRQRLIGILSLSLWIAVLFCGRMLAFV